MGKEHTHNVDRKRSLAKSVTWRILSTLTTISIVYLLFGRIDVALGYGGLEVLVKSVVYYFHERGWNRVGWGRSKKNN